MRRFLLTPEFARFGRELLPSMTDDVVLEADSESDGVCGGVSAFFIFWAFPRLVRRAELQLKPFGCPTGSDAVGAFWSAPLGLSGCAVVVLADLRLLPWPGAASLVELACALPIGSGEARGVDALEACAGEISPAAVLGRGPASDAVQSICRKPLVSIADRSGGQANSRRAWP